MLAAQQFRRVRRNRTAAEKIECRRIGLHDVRSQGPLADEEVAEPRPCDLIKHFVQARSTEVGVDQKHTPPPLCDGHRKVAGDGCLAVSRMRTCDQHAALSLRRCAELQIGSDAAKRLSHHRPRRITNGRLDPFDGNLFVIRVRHRTEHGNVHVPNDVLRGSHRLVH